MALTILNLRSNISGQQPTSLEPGQICFNLPDRKMYVGDGTNTNTDFDGVDTPGVPGLGWFSMPLDLAELGGFFLVSPDYYGQLPQDGDTLTWNAALARLEWNPGAPIPVSSAGYLMTNAEVVAVPGTDITTKINAVIAPAVAVSGNTAIVQGFSGDLYEGVYTYINGVWEFGSYYAQPVAAAIAYDNTISGLSAGDVQGAIDELSAEKVNSPLTAPLPNQVLSWNGTATEWTSDAGGSVVSVTGTSPIIVDNTDPTSPVVTISAASTLAPGAVQLNDTVTSTSDTVAATANAVRIAYDLANTAEIDAQQAISDAAAAQSTANTAAANATQALSDAAAAQATADQAILDAAAAQATADQAVLDAAAAQATADAALPLAGGTMTGIINFSGTQPTATLTIPNIVRLTDSVSSVSVTTAATPNSVRAAYDLAAAALPLSGGTMSGDITFAAGQQFPVSGIQGASTTQTGVVQLLDSVSSTSNAYAATPHSVKIAYDAAVNAQATADAALPKSGGTMTGLIVFDPAQTFPTSSIADATTTTKGIVQIGSNINVASGVISVTDGDTTAKGVVQLTDALNSTSTTLGLTAYGGYQLQQQIDTLNLLSNLTFCGTINASTGLLTSVTDAGIAHGFTVGLPLPSPDAVTDDHFVVVSVPGTFTPTGGASPVVCNQGDWILGIEPTPGVYEWALQPVGYDAPSATTTTEGVVYLATDAEVQAGTDSSNKAVVPSSLQSKLSDSISLTSSTTIASSTAVKTAYDLADAAVPDASYTAKGDILAGTGAGSYNAVSVGTNGYVLTADSGQSTGVKWEALPVGPGSAQPSVEGLVYGLTTDSLTGYNVSLGYGANGTLTTGSGNIAIGSNSGSVTTGSYNVAVGYDVNVDDPTADKQLAIGPDSGSRWLTGDSSMNIKPGAGIIDRLNTTGASGQILSSTSTGIEWINNAPDGVQSVTGSAPITVDNTDPVNPVVEVSSATLTDEGVVQLEDSVTSTSTTTAATPNSVKTSYDLANAALPKAGGTMSGDITLDAALVDGVGSPGTSGYVLSSTATGVQWVPNTADGVLGVTGTSPIVVDNTDPANPVISVDSGSLTGTGVLQLTDSVSSSSITTAATPNSVKSAYDLANAALPRAGGTMSGDITLDAALVDSVGSPGTSGYILSSTVTGVEWVPNNADGVLSVTGTSPVQVDNTDPANPVISVQTGTVSRVGVVQLTDSISSSSITTAATPNSVKTVYDLATVAMPKTGGTFTGDVNFASGKTLSMNAGSTLTSSGTVDLYGTNNVYGNTNFGPSSQATFQYQVNFDNSSQVSFVSGSTTAVNGSFTFNVSPIFSTGVNIGPAIKVTYDNTTSGLTATNVQAAIDEIASSVNLDYIPKSAFSLSGQLLVGVGPSTYAALDPGSADYVLSSDAFGNLAWVQSVKGNVVGVTGIAPISVDNTDPQNPVISADVATTAALGVVQVGTNVDVSAGTISVKTGSATDLGVLQVGTNIDVSSGVISVKTADTSNLGIVRVGSNIDVSSGTISVKTGSATDLGVLQVGTNIDVSSGTISVKTADNTNLGVVQTGTNIQNTAGVISVLAASTSQQGVVQLNDTLSSTSTTEALTANKGYDLQQQIDALAVTSNLTLAGTYDASTGLVDSVTTAGTAAGFVVGSALPAAVPGNSDYFVIVDVQGSTGPAGTPPYHIGDWFLSDGSSWQFLNVGFQAAYATTTSDGVVQLATDAEVQAGSNTTHVVVPSSLQSKMSDSISTTSSTTIASSTAVKTAYDLADAAMPKAGGTFTGNVYVSSGTSISIDMGASLDVSGTLGVYGTANLEGSSYFGAASYVYFQNSVSFDSTSVVYYQAGSSTTVDGSFTFNVSPTFSPGVDIGPAVKVTYDNTSSGLTATEVQGAIDEIAAISTNALLKSGGTMTGGINLAAAGVTFSNSSQLTAITDSISTTSSTTAASATAVKSAYDLANAALPKAGGTMTGLITFAAGQTFPITGIQDATTGQKGVVQIGSNIDVSSGVISVASGSTTVAGILQLTNSTSSTSTTTAATPSSVKTAYDLANAAVPKSAYTTKGDILAGTGAGTYSALSLGTNGYVLTADSSQANGVKWAAAGGATGVQTVTATAGSAITVINTDPQNPKVGVNVATTAVFGVTQLNDGVTSTSTTTAATANSVKTAYDLAFTKITKPSSPTPSEYSLVVDNAGSGTTKWAIRVRGLYSTGAINIDNSDPFFPSVGVNEASAPAPGTVGTTRGVVYLSDKLEPDISNAATVKLVNTVNTNANTKLPISAYTNKGVLIAGTGASFYDALSVGTDGQVLLADSTSSTGLAWGDATIPGLSTPSVVAAADQLGLVYDLSDGKIKSVVAYDAGTF